MNGAHVGAAVDIEGPLGMAPHHLNEKSLGLMITANPDEASSKLWR